MRAVSAAFKEIRNKKQITGENRVLTKVVLVDLAIGDESMIELVENDLLISVGNITSRIERVTLNDFAPEQVSVTVHDPQDYPVFFKSDGTGKFDSVSTMQYQVKVYKGITIGGAVEWGESIFDGEILNSSIERKRRSIIEFTVIGWLKESERYNAEEVADKDNPPWKKVTGLTVNYVGGGIEGTTGGKSIEISDETGEGTATRKSISYCGGRREWIYKYPGTGNTICYEPNFLGKIRLTYDYSATPDKSEKDYFAVIVDEGSLLACGWWVNRTLEFVLNKLLNHMWGEGIGTRDIEVEEIGGGVEQKMFIYLPPIYETGPREDVKITASKVIDYNDETKEITMLVAVEWKKEENNKLYKIVINTENKTTVVTVIQAVPLLSRIVDIYYTGTRWWILVGRKKVGIIEEDEWYATYFLRLDLALTQVDFTRTIPYNHTLPGWYHYNLYSFTADETGNDFYCIRQEAEAGMVYTIKLYRYDIVLNTWSSNGTMYDEAYAYNRGTWVKQDGTLYMYYDYACKKQNPDYSINETTSYIMAYHITSSTNVEMKTFASAIGTVVSDFCWNQRTTTPPNMAFIKIEDGDAYWIWKTVAYICPNGELIKYFGHNDEDDQIYTSWQYREEVGGSQWRIMFFHGNTILGGNIETEDILRSDYFGNITNPRVFKKNATDDYYYAGFVTDTSNRVIPFIYIRDVVIARTVEEADFTDFSIRKALSQLAIAFLCTVSMSGYEKISFRHRESYRDTDTLDWDQYEDTPIVRIWKHYYDGVIIKNSREGLFTSRGDIGYNAKVLTIDNRFISEGNIEEIANWYYNFYNKIRKLIHVERNMYIEPELMDKITIALRMLNGAIMWNLATIVMEASFVPLRKRKDYYRMKLELLEIEGVEYRQHILEEVGEGIST